MKLLCNKHKKYKAVRKPIARCAECWKFYVKSNPHKKLSKKDIDNFARAIIEALLFE